MLAGLFLNIDFRFRQLYFAILFSFTQYCSGNGIRWVYFHGQPTFGLQHINTILATWIFGHLPVGYLIFMA